MRFGGKFKIENVVVQSLSHVPLFTTPWIIAHQTFLPFTISLNLLKLMSTESVMPSNHLVLFCPLLLPSVFPSIRVFSSWSALRIRWPKYWSFSFSISSSNAYSGLISFRTDCLDLFPVQGTLKNLLQHHISKASILLALSLLYGPTLTSTHTSMFILTTGQTMIFDCMNLCQQSDVSAV